MVLFTGREYATSAGFAYRDTLCKRKKWAVAVLKFFWYEKFGGKAQSKVIPMNHWYPKNVLLITVYLLWSFKVLVALMGKLLAHEIAHIIGIKHDGDANSCSKTTKSNKLMTPVVAQDASTWSACTRKAAIKMVKNGADHCLKA